MRLEGRKEIVQRPRLNSCPASVASPALRPLPESAASARKPSARSVAPITMDLSWSYQQNGDRASWRGRGIVAAEGETVIANGIAGAGRYSGWTSVVIRLRCILITELSRRFQFGRGPALAR